MNRLQSTLGIDLPILAAPMAGGPSTPELVAASAQAGGAGFLAGGYKTSEALADQIDVVQAQSIPFGVNLFAPNPIPVSTRRFRSYARAIQPDADHYGLQLAEEPLEDDDHWAAKVDLLTSLPVPWVSFTFGIPDRTIIAALRKAGTVVLQSVTSAREARQAVDTGVDGLIVQAHSAGGHSATLTPEQPLKTPPLPVLANVIRQTVAVPIIATGGVAGPEEVAAAVHAGADAVMVGTALLRADESGASEPHKAALADPAFTETVMTRAFTGRPARALRNYFIEQYDPVAPEGYPALHNLTSPLRKAATAAGDTRLIHLWAGTGYREARSEPTSRILERLASQL